MAGAGRAARLTPRPFLWLAGCLVSEYLLISILFDARHLEERVRWLSGIGYVGPLLIAIGTAALLLGKSGLGLVSEVFASKAVPVDSGRRWPQWLTHLVLFAAFFELTRRLVASRPLLPGQQTTWFVLWVFLGAASVVALLLTAVPPGFALSLLRRMRWGLLTAVLVGGLAWCAGRWAERLWTPLGYLTLRAVAALLRLFSTDVISLPERLQVGLRGFQIRVAPICSGYEGIGLSVVLVGAYLVVLRKSLRFPRAFWLLPLAVVAAWSANVLRIAALIAVGSSWSAKLAYGGFHSKAGWILFCCTALGMAALARSAPFSASTPEAPEQETWNPTVPFVLPFVVMGATALAVGLVSPGPQVLAPLRAVAGLVVLWLFRRSYAGLRPSLGIAPLLTGLIVFGLWVALEEPGAGQRGEELRLTVEALGRGRVPWLLLRALGSVVVAPVAEELAFRGFLIRRLVSADFTEVPLDRFDLKSFLLSSLAFGAIHQAFWAGTLAGMAYAFAQQRRGRIGDAILAHSVTNLLLIAAALLGNRWSLWS